MTETRKDIYERVTEKIIDFLEAGASLTGRLWLSGTPGLPLRSTNEAYRGVNTILLWCASMERGFEHRHWMTYKNAAKMGAQVRKGEKGELVVYADQIRKTVENPTTGEPEERQGWFWKGYTV